MDIKMYHACESFRIEAVDRPDGFFMPYLHYHNSYELYFLERGQHSVLMNDRFFHVFPQDVVLYKPNVLHKSHDTQNYARTCVYFTEEFLQEYFSEKAVKGLLGCFQRTVIGLNTENFFRVKKLLLKMEKEYAKGDYSRIYVYLADILVLLSESENESRTETVFHAKDRLSPILEYIGGHYSTIKNLEEIASQMYITKFHLCRMFKKHTGFTISQYIMQIRMKHACELLVHTNQTVVSIAELCGFHSSMYFCRSFKNMFGVTPSEFRKRCTRM